VEGWSFPDMGWGREEAGKQSWFGKGTPLKTVKKGCKGRTKEIKGQGRVKTVLLLFLGKTSAERGGTSAIC